MSHSWKRYVLIGVVLACGASWVSAAEPGQGASAIDETKAASYGPMALATVGSVQPTVCPAVFTKCPATVTQWRRRRHGARRCIHSAR